MPSKSEIRQAISGILRLPTEVRAEKSAELCRIIAESAEWRTARTVAIFAPQPREPDVEMLWPYAAGKSVACPRVTEGQLDFYRIVSLDELTSGAFGIREPAADSARAVRPNALDLILVPGVAFAADGARLGRGGGFYDRLLASLAPHTCRIGVGFDSQILPELPVEAHDQNVDFIATESGLRPAKK